MTKEEFANEMSGRMQETLGDDYDVSVRKVTKNNNVELTGIMVSDPAKNIAPTLYVDEPYENFVAGRETFDEISERLIYGIRTGMPKQKIDMEFFTEWENVKDKICFRLVNAQRNEKMLEEVPHETCGELALTFFYAFENAEIGKGTIQIRNEHCETWGITNDELIEVAVENTPRLFPPECIPMESILMEMACKEYDHRHPELPRWPLEESPSRTMVLTNREKTYGASVIMYKDYLQRVAEAAQCDLFVVPSSVHECLIMPKTGHVDPEWLTETINEVNDLSVDPQEVLSGNLYFYDRQTQCLNVVAEGHTYGLEEGMELSM